MLAAPAQAQQEPNSVLIVLDASKSMNEDARNGKTRLQAAKIAVGEVIAKLPKGAPFGLRVYGSKVSETTKEQACQDTELTIPVGPLDANVVGEQVDALHATGRTPIGASLLAAADDLGQAKGYKSVVLISDGGDNCAPPDPCEAAQQVSKQGIDLSISVVGFQVNPRVRRQLQCIARGGAGSYVDVEDADQLADELQALTSRAYRTYEPVGTKIDGTKHPALRDGLFQDALTSGETRRYALQAPPNTRALLSVTAIPPHDARGSAEMFTEFFTPTGERVAGETQLLYGGLNTLDSGSVETTALRTTEPGEGGRHELTVELTKSNFDVPVPIELRVEYIAREEEVGAARRPGALLTPTPTATPTPPPPEPATDTAAWLVVGASALGGLLLGLAASLVLTRRRPA